MAEKIKFTAKELRKPDIYRQFFSDLIDKASENFNFILYCFAGVIVALIILFLFTSHSEKKSAEANKIFANALVKLNTGNIDEARADFKTVIDGYPSDKSAKLARYYSGLLNYEIGEYEESIKVLKSFINNSPQDKLLKESAELTIGLSNFNLKNWQKAITYFEKINDPQSPYITKAKVHLGLCYEKLGEFEKAREVYENYLDIQSN